MIPKAASLIDAKFKDDSPRNTVARIKRILNSYGIESSESWSETGVPDCYSLRVSVLGTSFGANGKGVTKDFALASAYGELMERLQIGRIFKSDQQKSGSLYATQSSSRCLPAKELLKRNKKWYTRYAALAEQITGVKQTEEDLLAQYTNQDGTIDTTTFYCVNTGTWEDLPTTLLNSVYTANGCAAGNTMEEALVQAISEIVERHFSMQILSEGIPVPDVPEDVLRSYPVAYAIINFLRENYFHVIVKDCSLGTKFPVVCVCLIDQTTGKYHTHFGAYPHFEIALQRTLTESFQGRNIEKVARYDNFAQNTGNFDLANLINQLVNGASEKRPEFFTNTIATYEKCCGFEGASNRELLKECIDFLSAQGWDILVRDCSCLDFPTYQVIVPGYSEVFVHRMVEEFNEVRFYKYAQPVLRNPSAASKEELTGFLINLTEIAKQKLAPMPFSHQANLPLQLSIPEERYIMDATIAHILYSLGRFKDVIKYIDKLLPKSNEGDLALLICIKRYLSFRAEGYSVDKIRTILDYFHQPEIVQCFFETIEEHKNPMDPFVLHCDGQCKSSCILYKVCTKKQTDALAQIINTKMQELDPSKLEEQFRQLGL